MRKSGVQIVTYRAPGRGWRALACILIGLGILLASWRMQSRLGVKLPFSLDSAKPTPLTEEAQPAREERDISLSAHEWYALQLGAFSTEGAAQQTAQAFIPRGAAGFVHFDGSAYRVMAAAYATRSEAQNVQQRLAEQGVSTYIHPCAFSSIVLRAGGEPKQIDALSEAMSYLDGLDGKFYALSNALDMRGMEDDQARAALWSEAATAKELAAALISAFPDGVPGMLEPIKQLLQSIALEGEENAHENSAARTGAALKKCQLMVFFGLHEFAAGVQ